MPRTLTDHDSIRRWAGERGASPALVANKGSRRQPAALRFAFEGASDGESLVHVGWDRWFEWFDASNLALVVEEESNVSELVSRDRAGSGMPPASSAKTDSERAALQRMAADGREAEIVGNQVPPTGDEDDEPDDEDDEEEEGEEDEEDEDDDVADDDEDENEVNDDEGEDEDDEDDDDEEEDEEDEEEEDDDDNR